MRRPKSANDNIMYDVSIDELVERSKCRKTGKVRFVSIAQATFFIYWLKWRYKKSRKRGKSFSKLKRPQQRRVYACAECKGFHLTKQSRDAYEQRRKRAG